MENLLSKIAALGLNADVLIIDDNSPDGTGQLAEQLSGKYAFVKVLHRLKKEGLGKAYKDGFRWGLNNGYDVMMQMDADLSHDINTVPVFLEEITRYDAVFGSRYLKGVRVYNWSFKRLLLSKLSNEFIKWVLQIDSTDTTTAFKCFRRNVIEAIDLEKLRGKQNAFLIELVYATIRAGFRTKEIPFMFTERATGESKMSLRVAFESLAVVFKLRLGL